MPTLIRRISMGKWKDYCTKASESRSVLKRLIKAPYYNAPADAITNCLKTSNNQLSMWLLQNDQSINEVLLAMCTGTKAKSPSSFEYIMIDTSELEAVGLSYFQSKDDADTAIPELKELHYDVSGFDYTTLGHFQDIIVNRIKNNKTIRKVSAELKPLVLDAVKKGRFDYSCLSDDYRSYLKNTFPEEAGVPNVCSESVVCPNCGNEIIIE